MAEASWGGASGVGEGDGRAASEVARKTMEQVIGNRRLIEEASDMLCLLRHRSVMLLAGVPTRELPAPSSLLVIGGSGTGKTHILRALADNLGMRHFSFDCSALTGEGWRGTNVGDIMRVIAEWQAKEPGRPALVIWDEADKIAKRDTREPSFDAQANMLKILDGEREALATRYRESLTFDGRACVHVFCGSFSGLHARVAERLRREARSRGSYADPTEDMSREELLRLVNDSDLRAWGFVEEFVNRIGLRLVTEALDAEALRKVLTDERAGIVPKLSRSMPPGCSLTVSEQATRLLVSEALGRGTGPRQMNAEVMPLAARAHTALMEDASLSGAEIIVEHGRLALGFARGERAPLADAREAPAPTFGEGNPRGVRLAYFEDGKEVAGFGGTGRRPTGASGALALHKASRALPEAIAAGGVDAVTHEVVRQSLRATKGAGPGMAWFLLDPLAPAAAELLSLILLFLFVTEHPRMCSRGDGSATKVSLKAARAMAERLCVPDAESVLDALVNGPTRDCVARRYWSGDIIDNAFSRELMRAYWTVRGKEPDAAALNEVARALVGHLDALAGHGEAVDAVRDVIQVAAGMGGGEVHEARGTL